MLSTERIRELLVALNDRLAKQEVVGEIGICGGAVMCLVFNAREATKDVDAIFEPTREIREAARSVAGEFGIEEDWLNDAVKGYFHVDPPREEVMHLSHLRVWAPTATYMIAMKCISARFDSHDRDDVEFLVHYLEIEKPREVFDIIKKYYPDQKVPAKSRFLIEEMLTT